MWVSMVTGTTLWLLFLEDHLEYYCSSLDIFILNTGGIKHDDQVVILQRYKDNSFLIQIPSYFRRHIDCLRLGQCPPLEYLVMTEKQSHMMGG
jgi:hypothetical protein